MALIIVLSVMAIFTALGTTAALMASSNLGSARSDREADVAQNLSEAGVAQAVAWLRTNGVGRLSCSPTCNPSVASSPGVFQPDWGQGPNTGAGPNTTIAVGAPYGHLVSLSSGRQYRVWIEKISAFHPPSTTAGVYTVHAEGLYNAAITAAGKRSVSVDLTVAPFKFPLGVFAHTVAAGGSGGIHHETLFSDSCIQGREFQTFEGIDKYYGVPAAAHSAGAIVPKQNDQCNKANSIHKAAPCNPGVYANDTDAHGGPLANGDGCKGNGSLRGAPWLTTSKELSFVKMAETYGFEINPLGLSNSVLDELRTVSQQQGFYITDSTAIPAVLRTVTAAATHPNPVLFYDLKGAAVGGTVDLKDLTGYSRPYPVAENDSRCTPAGAIVIVLNGNAKLNSGTVLVASVFVPGPSPNGVINKANGAGQLIGTLYGDTIDMRGTSDVYLDQCFLDNLPGGLLKVTTGDYRENDR